MAASTQIPVTQFAPAERVPIDIIHRQAAGFDAHPLAPLLLNSVLDYVFVLNQQRQIVFASQNALELVPGKSMQDILGKRPGEALNCVHATTCPSGCGTSEFCSQCGAVRAILAGLEGRRDVQECHLTRLIQCEEESVDLLVLAAPVVLNGERFSVFSVLNVSHEKRRRALERIFFHDVINLASGAEGLLGFLTEEAPPDLRNDLELSKVTVHDLREEVETQRDLAAAERDELKPILSTVNSVEVLRQLSVVYNSHPVSAGKKVMMDPKSASVSFQTDPSLLKRVLGNLIKNAVEASREGETVTTACESRNSRVLFTVHNPGAMPREVQLQIFSRSFSTKGLGRGLGTYSVRLLAHKYLKGSVSFTSGPEGGTTFFVDLPAHSAIPPSAT